MDFGMCERCFKSQLVQLTHLINEHVNVLAEQSPLFTEDKQLIFWAIMHSYSQIFAEVTYNSTFAQGYHFLDWLAIFW